MLEVFGEAPCGWKSGITPVVEGTTEYIRRFLSYPEELRSRVGAYLTGWLMRLVDVISGKITDLMEDKNEKIWDMDATGACVLADFLTVLITGNGFGEVTGRAFDLFGDSIAEAEKRSPGPLSPLNGAVSVGDITTFEKLWAYDDIRELVKKKKGDGGDENGEPGEDGEESEEYSFHSPKLTLYPAKSLQMLDRLYTLGLLLPGTEEGKSAFCSLIGFFNPSREIIERTRHPSYFRKDYGPDDSPLVLAVKNPRFSPDNYDLLVGSPFDVLGRSLDYGTLPPIAAAVESGEKRKVEALIALGADISWHDRRGNNIYHRLMGEGARTGSAVEQTAGHLLGERNRRGKTPLEYNASKSRSAFYNCTPLTLWEALDVVFRESSSRTPDSLMYMENRDDLESDDIEAPFFMLNSAAKMIRAYIADRYGKESGITTEEIWRYDDLVKFWKETADVDGRRVLIIPEISFVCPPGSERKVFDIIMDLYRRDGVVLFAMTRYYLERLFDEVTAEDGRINIFVGKTKTGFRGDMLIGHTGTSALRRSEFLLRCGEAYYITEGYIDDGREEVNDYPFFPYEDEGY